MKKKALNFRFFFIICLFFSFYNCQTDENTRPNRDSDELYDTTFAEVSAFLKKIDQIIKKSDYEAWKINLTRAFIARFSDPVYLHELSQKPYLKSQNIELKSLHDYFIRVFIPSRIETQSFTIDRIEFIGETRVKAITMVGDVPYVLYLLEKDENNEWKIGVW